MKKAALVKAILHHIRLGKIRSKTGEAFLEYFAQYLIQMKIPADEEYDFWQIDHYLPKIIVAAFERLRSGTDPLAREYSDKYRIITGSPEIPNLLELGSGNGVEQVSVILSLSSEMAEIMNMPWIKDAIEGYCTAQPRVVQQSFDMFSRKVYQRGLSDIINKCKLRGMSGTFGNTELRTYVIAGRIMITFARKIGRGGEELSVTFVGEDKDPFLLSAGLQSCYAGLRDALDMIEDVVSRWPADTTLQQKRFVEDKEIKMDAVAAMEAAGKK